MGTSTHMPPTLSKDNTQYKTKPVVKHAIQWNGGQDNFQTKQWVESFGDDFNKWFVVGEGDDLKINTLESNGNLHTVTKEDFIVRGLKGEYYSCKPDIFANSYEKVQTNEAVEAGL